MIDIHSDFLFAFLRERQQNVEQEAASAVESVAT